MKKPYLYLKNIYLNFEKKIHNPKFIDYLFFTVIIILSILIRHLVIGQETQDYKTFLSPWFDYINDNGRFLALKDNFSNYNLPYLYLMTISTYLTDFGLSKIYSIKIISIIFDYFLAFWVYKIIKLGVEKVEVNKNEKIDVNSKLENIKSEEYSTPFAEKLPILGALSVLFAPTVILNGASWGQSDTIYTSFILMSLFYLLKQRYIWMMIAFAIAVSFKLQAVFFLPVILVLFILARINLMHFLIIPIVYILTLVPALIIGRGFVDMLKIYPRQSTDFKQLSLNSATFYNWLGNLSYEIYYPFGMVLASVVVIGIIYLFWCKKSLENVYFWLHLALLCALSLPFFLPKMHERYFFVADVISIIYAFILGYKSLVDGNKKFKNVFWIPISINLVSLFSYGFLTGFNFFPLSLLSLIVFINIVYTLKYSIFDIPKNT
jgi:Gpi18-like mannosyltransferase